MLAYVAHYSAPASHFRITHADRAIAFGPYTPLDTGDRIQALRPGASMKILVDGAPYTVTTANSPMCIGTGGPGCKASARPRASGSLISTALRNVFAMIAWQFRTADEYVNAAQTVPMRTRGSNSHPVIPLLHGGPETARITGRGFALAWVGGTAPFSLTISRGATTVAAVSSNTHSVKLPALVLPPGTYDVTLADKLGRAASGEFIATGFDDRRQEPQCPPALRNDPACADVEAAELTRHGSQWHLAAYERLAFSATPTQPGRLLAQWLTEVPPQ